MPLDLIHPSRGDSIFDGPGRPETVVLAADRSHLRLVWCEGDTATLRAEDIRLACRCAWCTRARIDGTFEARFENAHIASIEPVGDYALNIGFADGHARGVFPWSYLRAIGLLCKVAEQGPENMNELSDKPLSEALDVEPLPD